MDGSVFVVARAERMEYRVVRKTTNDLDDGFASMENRVNQALMEGWQLVGGLSVTTRTDNLGLYILTQAVQRVRPLPGNNRTTMVNVDINSLNPLNNINRVSR